MRSRLRYASKWMQIYLVVYFFAMIANVLVQHYFRQSLFADICNYFIIPVSSTFTFFVLSLMVKETDSLNNKADKMSKHD